VFLRTFHYGEVIKILTFEPYCVLYRNVYLVNMF